MKQVLGQTEKLHLFQGLCGMIYKILKNGKKRNKVKIVKKRAVRNLLYTNETWI
jgi:hypothetical protein